MKSNWQLVTASNDGDILTKCLSAVGITTKEEKEKFLNTAPTLNTDIHISDLQPIFKRLLRAKELGEQVIIHGDYDADGIVSTSILWDFLFRELEINVLPVIPNRFNEGYGLSEKSIARMREMGAKLIITVDCGIKNLDLILENPDIDFIITDHHTYPENEDGSQAKLAAPNLIGIVHSQKEDDNLGFREICGAYVVYKLILKLAEEFRDKLKDFDINKYVDLVSIATVTDVMPIVKENRDLLKLGLAKINNDPHPNLKTLLDVSGKLHDKIDMYHFGFVIGPRLNAPGRIDDAIKSVRMLSTNRPEKAKEIAKKLDKINTRRQELTQELLDDAMSQIDQQRANGDYLLVCQGKNWPEGIVGLIAGRICEKYKLPTLVVSITEEENDIKIVGSARSPEIFDVTRAIGTQADKLVKFGGHVQAAGFTVIPGCLEGFSEGLKALAKSQLKGKNLSPTIKIVSNIELSEVTLELLESLETLKPHGVGNPKPRFLLENVKVSRVQHFGNEKRHAKLFLQSENGSNICLGFNKADKLPQSLQDKTINLVASLKINEWNGKKEVQLEYVDYEVVNDES